MIKWHNQQKRENFNTPGGCGAWRFHDEFSRGACGGGDLCMWFTAIMHGTWPLLAGTLKKRFIGLKALCMWNNTIRWAGNTPSWHQTFFPPLRKVYHIPSLAFPPRRTRSPGQAEGATPLTVIFSPPATLLTPVKSWLRAALCRGLKRVYVWSHTSYWKTPAWQELLFPQSTLIRLDKPFSVIQWSCNSLTPKDNSSDEPWKGQKTEGFIVTPVLYYPSPSG